MNLFLDTNIFLRYFVKNNEQMYLQVENILTQAEEGKVKLATSTIVLTEIIYTLKSFYKRNHEEIQKHVDSILSIKNLLLIERTNFEAAYKLFKKHEKKISDCLIVTQVPKNYKLCSFDEVLEKLSGHDRFVHPKILS